MPVPENVGCKNMECIKSSECKRFEIQEKNIAKEVKKFGGNRDKGCGKFIPRESTDNK